MYSADYAVARCLSVCPSHAGILSKRLYISSKFFHHRVAPPFWFFRTKQDGNISTGTPLMGAVFPGHLAKSQSLGPILAI